MVTQTNPGQSTSEIQYFRQQMEPGSQTNPDQRSGGTQDLNRILEVEDSAGNNFEPCRPSLSQRILPGMTKVFLMPVVKPIQYGAIGLGLGAAGGAVCGCAPGGLGSIIGFAIGTPVAAGAGCAVGVVYGAGEGLYDSASTVVKGTGNALGRKTPHRTLIAKAMKSEFTASNMRSSLEAMKRELELVIEYYYNPNEFDLTSSLVKEFISEAISKFQRDEGPFLKDFDFKVLDVFLKYGDRYRKVAKRLGASPEETQDAIDFVKIELKRAVIN